MYGRPAFNPWVRSLGQEDPLEKEMATHSRTLAWRIPWTAKGTFYVKVGTIKDRNGMDLTEAEDIKKWWQEYPEELYKKDLHDPDNHDGMITHLEPDILECAWSGRGSRPSRRTSG